MATRLYINRDVWLRLSAAAQAEWEKATGFQRYKLNTAKRTTSPHSSLFSVVIAAQGTAGNDTLLFQGVSDPLDVDQTIAGTVKGQARFAEAALTLDARAQCIIWVAAPDGSVRGVLCMADAGALASEFGTALANRKVPRGGAIALSSVAALAGDRIIWEIGARQHAAGVNNLTLSVGYAATDLAEDETTTAANAPWLEFSQNLTFTSEANIIVTRQALSVLVQGDAALRVSRAALTVLVKDPVGAGSDQVVMIG